MLVCWTRHARNVSHDAREQVSFGPISWLMVGEVFPLAVRGQASALATMTNFASNFAVRRHARAVSAATACQRARILASLLSFVAPVQAGHPGARLGLRIPPMVSAAPRLHTCASRDSGARLGDCVLPMVSNATGLHTCASWTSRSALEVLCPAHGINRTKAAYLCKPDI